MIQFDLSRFIKAQETVFEVVLNELQNGKKETHWMWFIFPQLKELGFSPTAKYYGINGIDEAQAYLRHPVLRKRLEECVRAVLNCKANNPVIIFGHPDHLKFHSSLTLFARAEPENILFKEALEKFYQGITDFETEKIITNSKQTH